MHYILCEAEYKALLDTVPEWMERERDTLHQKLTEFSLDAEHWRERAQRAQARVTELKASLLDTRTGYGNLLEELGGSRLGGAPTSGEFTPGGFNGSEIIRELKADKARLDYLDCRKSWPNVWHRRNDKTWRQSLDADIADEFGAKS